MANSTSGDRSLRTRLVRRTLAVLEMPLAVIDTTLDHRIGAIATARELLAFKIREMDEEFGAGIDGNFEPASSEPTSWTPEPAAAPEPVVAYKAEPEAPAVEEEPVAEEPAEVAEPFEGYVSLNVHKVSKALRDADEDVLAKVEAFETANKNRKTIHQAVARRRERIANPIDL